MSLMSGLRRGPSPADDRVRGRWMRRAGGGRLTTLAALSAYAGGGGGGGEARGERAANTGAAAVMTASINPDTRNPMTGRGDARAEPGREGGRDTWVSASTKTTAFDATSGSSASIQYSTVESRSSAGASSTRIA